MRNIPAHGRSRSQASRAERWSVRNPPMVGSRRCRCTQRLAHGSGFTTRCRMGARSALKASSLRYATPLLFRQIAVCTLKRGRRSVSVCPPTAPSSYSVVKSRERDCRPNVCLFGRQGKSDLGVSILAFTKSVDIQTKRE